MRGVDGGQVGVRESSGRSRVDIVVGVGGLCDGSRCDGVITRPPGV